MGLDDEVKQIKPPPIKFVKHEFEDYFDITRQVGEWHAGRRHAGCFRIFSEMARKGRAQTIVVVKHFTFDDPNAEPTCSHKKFFSKFRNAIRQTKKGLDKQNRLYTEHKSMTYNRATGTRYPIHIIQGFKSIQGGRKKTEEWFMYTISIEVLNQENPNAY